VLEIIKQMNFPFGSLRCNDFLVLWHVPGFVNFTLVVDLDIDAYPRLLRTPNPIGRSSISRI
jgi:hypothetical protein